MMRHILWFRDLRSKDVKLVGGKAASLGEMISQLQGVGVEVPDGFAMTVSGYNLFIDQSPGLREFIKKEVAKVRHTFQTLQAAKKKLKAEKQKEQDQRADDLKKNYEDSNRSFQRVLVQCGESIRKRISRAAFPEELSRDLEKAYQQLCQKSGLETLSLAVRSSATAEDLPDASFAGQQDTYLNISGLDEVKKACLNCFASLFSNRAISYREDVRYSQLKKAAEAKAIEDEKSMDYHQTIARAVDHLNVGISVAIQLMVRSDLASSGVIFTIDTESGYTDVVYITAAWGLGEYVVQGRVNPDQHYVFKPTKSVIDEKPGLKDVRLVYGEDGGVREEVVPVHQRKSFCLSQEEVMKLAEWALLIEKHYGQPIDIEWAKDGLSNKLFIVQARPETVHSTKSTTEIYQLLERPDKPIMEGEAVGNKIGRGAINIIEDTSKLSEFVPDEVLVTDMTNPDWESIMKVASAIVTNRGGRTCHAAIVSREIGIPCVIGTGHATQVLKDGQKITVDCSEGQGLIYEGLLPFKISKLDPDRIPKTRTKVMLNIGIPEQSFSASLLPHDGVGLAREEFIINSHIQIHPLALVHYGVLELLGHQKGLLEYARKVVLQIESLTAAYLDKTQYFIDKLAFGIGRIAAGFYPKKVIIRLSDFKSNEYANLIGGKLFEPQESNPMIGWRGCSRYYDKRYQAAFILECKAIVKVRNEMKLSNVMVMLPFCRTPEEGEKVSEILGEQGLVRGEPRESPLELYCMAEIPSNIVLADEFSKIVDGFSIGSNDLTQLALGLDRDSELLSHLYDERNAAVKKMISQLIETAHRNGCKVGICGQAPSDFPSFTAFLVEQGIDSISLNPDTFIQTKALIFLMESAKDKGIHYEEINEEFIHKTLKKYGNDLIQEVIRLIDQERQKKAKELRITPRRPARM
ncbi:MAG: phosphoenolpyruvate synthase [Candidatus Aminicenantes bacterium]|nr:phosphoenolpyruvate synthase [Candidatus Aminicenantes bacterium]